VEFKHKEVAAIAAEAMNNYLMLSKILKVHVMPSSDLHPKMYPPSALPLRPFLSHGRCCTTPASGGVGREHTQPHTTTRRALPRMHACHACADVPVWALDVCCGEQSLGSNSEPDQLVVGWMGEMGEKPALVDDVRHNTYTDLIRILLWEFAENVHAPL